MKNTKKKKKKEANWQMILLKNFLAFLSRHFGTEKQQASFCRID